jgi:aspartate aminotransferase
MTLRAGRRMEGIDRTLIRRIFDAAPKGAINLGLGQPDLPTPPRISEAGIEGIRNGKTGYTSTAGDPALRAAIATRYAPFASAAENVVVTIGSQEAMFAVLMTLCDPGDEVLYPDPGYPAYPVVARLLGASGVPFPLRPERAFRVDPDDVLSRITPRTRAVILCSPSNPTGAIDRAEDLERLAAGLAQRGVPWISDEIYAGFAYEGPAPSIRAFSPEGGVVISGLSKDLSMTGWRVGWACGPASFIARVIAAHQYVVTCASSVSQAAALAAFSGDHERERGDYLDIFRRRRALMAEELSRIGGIRFAMPDGAFYFFVDVSDHGDATPIAMRLLETRKVVTIPGEAFGSNARGWLRLSYAAADADIVTGVRALGEVLG